MKLYNTLSRKVENFVPIKNKTVSIYSCGPTVYDHIHVGNLSSFIYADTLRRVLKANDYKVDHIMNFTDVNDKIIDRSAQQYPDDEPMMAMHNLTQHYSEIFLNDLKAVGFDVEAVEFVKATDNIEAMQDLIRDLYEKKFAYITEDGVYFSIDTYKKAGKKYGQLTEVTVDSTSQARIRNDEYDKESAHDFALWKLQVGDEPSWEFELDGHQLAGRPGWHIECSAMSVKNLGQPFDIHTGGVDLIFPHHENEIAQSTATDGDLYAKYFVHNEHLLVDGRKMSKSLNNFYTLRDVIEKGYDPLAFRLMILQSHYRNQSNFTWENLEAAQNRLKDLRSLADLKFQTYNEKQPLQGLEFDKVWADISEQLSNDLNTPEALSRLSDLINQIKMRGVDNNSKESFEKFLKNIDEVLGLQLSGSSDITKEQKELISEREKARQGKDWDKADQLRKVLEEQKIGLRDTDQGAIWYRL